MKVQQAESEVLINRNSCSIHSQRSVVSASEMSHEWCEVSLKIDRATSRDHVEEGCERTQYKTY